MYPAPIRHLTAAAPDLAGLRVALLAPISWRVPPRHYGPWELFASLLAEGLVARGVDLTLFASGDSLTAGRLSSVVPHGWSEDPSIDPKAAECLHIATVFEQAADFDLIHNSFDFLPLTYSRLVTTPMLTTIHGFSSPKILPVYQRYNATTHYVAISDADRHPSLDYLATIHHGIDTDQFQLPEQAGQPHGQDPYLLFFGRIHPHKGTAEAIATAKAAGLPLVIAGIVQDQAYFDAAVAPHIDGHRVRFLGPIGPDQRAGLLGGALALLHLISFDEPFGFSVVEAMACGTPVIACKRGSMPEVIDHGTTGLLVSSIEEAVAAVAAVAGLDRPAIRARAVARFGQDRMVDEYLAAYASVLHPTPAGH